MSFWLYRKSQHESGARYTLVKEVKLTGTTGPLARFLQERGSEETPFAWSLTGEEVIGQLAPDLKDPENYAIVLDLAAESITEAQLQQLVRIHGVSEYDSSDLVFVFRSLFIGPTNEVASSFKKEFTVPLPLDRREMVEALCLTGGTNSGRYFWTSPKMNIGAAICPSR